MFLFSYLFSLTNPSLSPITFEVRVCNVLTLTTKL